MSKRVFVAAMAVVCAGSAISNAANSPFDFTLRSHEGREWSDSDFKDRQLVVVAFLGTECPLVKLYGPRLQQISEKYGDKVAIFGINSNTQDSMTEMSAFAERHGVRFPLLKDTGNVVADQFDAKRTPEVFLLDADRNVRYHGQIDDQYGVGIIKKKADRQYLNDAIDALLNEQDVALTETDAVGCVIGRVKKIEPKGDITYSNQISRIFQNRCIECHRSGELAPFTLTSYDDVVGWEDTICEVIADNRMPPWFANPEHGKFKNDCRLSKEEKETVYTWVANGMPEGDPAELPEPRQFVEGWRIPKPDQIFYMSEEPFTIPAQGTVDYQHFTVDPGWTEDKYIMAADARPGNKSVVHHILVFVVEPGQNTRGGLGDVLMGYAPGTLPVILEDGVAMKVKAGSKLVFQMHYTPNGYVEQDRSYGGVKFIDEKDVTQLMSGRLAINPELEIPANADNHQEVAEYRVSRDEVLVSMTPHMHLRGKSFRYEAFYPNGDQEVLLDVPNYDFNWQIKYILEEPRLLPRGTTIKCVAHYDNSKKNIVNPNPGETVYWGDQSWEEMLIGFFNTLPVAGQAEASAAPKKSSASIDPSGIYKWKGPSPGSLELKLVGDLLTGNMNSRGRQFRIEEAVIVNDLLTFTVDAGQALLEFEATVTETGLQGKTKFTAIAAGRTGEFPWVAGKQKSPKVD